MKDTSSTTGMVVGFSEQLVAQGIAAFESAFSFTLGLITHEIVANIANGHGVTTGQITSWFIFVLITFTVPYLTGQYRRMVGLPVHPTLSTGVDSHGRGSTHQFWMRS